MCIELRHTPQPLILAVEDSEHDRRALARASAHLEDSHLLHIVSTAEECIASLEAMRADGNAAKPGAFLLDMALPGMNCIELIDYIRSSPSWDESKIFVYSGFYGSMASKAKRDPRIDGFFEKRAGTLNVVAVLKMCIQAANQSITRNDASSCIEES